MAASLSHRRVTPFQEFLFGSPYYPEHWEKAIREKDPALFRAAGWNVVRMAEFAWDRMEPSEGTFDFSLFDETIERFGAVGIRTILCTPTATPPRWLTMAYPEVLRVNADGIMQVHGSRQHASYFSTLYREYSRKITRAMAAHFRSNPHVIGWQTDNEFHCHFRADYSVAARAAWREWLRARFHGDIAALNEAWGTAFWALTYSSFEEVEIPVADRPTWPNPSIMLDYHRFLSDGVATFQRDQVEILREANPVWFVTHNGCFDSIDYRGAFTRDLDFLGYDSYPFFDRDPANRAASHAFNLDWVRAYSGHFLILEQQSGPGGQGDYFLDHPEPGEMRRLAWASVAHGADGLLFFRERTCRFGAEEYWMGVIDHDNVPRRRYHEAVHVGAELTGVGRELLGTTVQVDVAVAGADFDAEHGHAVLSLGLPGTKKMAETVHGVFFRGGYSVGVIHPEDSLDGVSLYVIPHLSLFDPKWVPAIEAFVQRGGTVVIGARTATKDLRNQVVAETLPGVLRALVGATVEEYGRQNAPEKRPLAVKIGEKELVTELWYEQLVPDAGTEVIGTWTTRHLAGSAAVTRRKVGEGQVIYVGTYLTREVMEALVPELERLGGLPLPAGPGGEVETIVRVGAGKSYRIFINHSEQAATVALSRAGRELLKAVDVSGSISLLPNEIAVVRE